MLRPLIGAALGAALLLASGCAAAPPVSPEPAGTRLDRIRARGQLNCGVARSIPGFSVVHAADKAAGFDADLCRAIAATIFGDPQRLRFIPLDTVTEFLNDDRIDVVFHRLTWNFERELRWNIAFGPVTFHDGQAFLVRDDAAIRKLSDLIGQRVCVEASGPFAANLSRHVRRAPGIEILLLDDAAAARLAFREGRCAAWSRDVSLLLGEAPLARPRDHRILPERISEEPLAPVLRSGDTELQTVVRWTILALIAAEAAGVTAADAISGKAAPDLFRLPASHHLGLEGDWVRKAVSSVGNYGELYARHFGGRDRPKHHRGPNQPWTSGGLMYAPPFASLVPKPRPATGDR